MFHQSIAFLLRPVKEHIDMLIAGFCSNPLHARQSFEHALNALLTALSSDSLIPDNFQGDGFEHERLLLSLAHRTRAAQQAGRPAAHVPLS